MRRLVTQSLYVFIVGAAFVLCSAGIGIAQNREALHPSPKLEIDSLEHNFGQVMPGMALTYTFKIQNSGTADLLIKSVIPGCGCTTSDFDKIIAPGNEGKITLAIAITDHLEGHLSKQAIVQTNDPGHASFALSLLADFKKRDTGGLNILPSDQWTISLLKGSTATTTIKILNGTDVPLHISKIDAGGKSFDVSLKTNEYGSSYSVIIEIPKSLAVGHYKQVATVFTDNPVMSQIPIHLEATVSPELSVTPVSLKLTDVPVPGDDQKMDLPTITVSKSNGNLKIKHIHCNLSFIKLEISPRVADKTYEIHLSLDSLAVQKLGAKAIGDFSGYINIETNDSDFPVIQVPVTGTFKTPVNREQKGLIERPDDVRKY